MKNLQQFFFRHPQVAIIATVAMLVALATGVYWTSALAALELYEIGSGNPLGSTESKNHIGLLLAIGVVLIGASLCSPKEQS